MMWPFRTRFGSENWLSGSCDHSEVLPSRLVVVLHLKMPPSMNMS